MVKQIPLSRGQFALVDDEDYGVLSQFTWYCEGTRYAARDVKVAGRRFHLKMHRELLSVPYGDKRKVDHVNRDGLDNRRENLRVATQIQNGQNMERRTYGGRPRKAPYKGIWQRPAGGRWCAEIQIDGKKVRLGRYVDPRDAALAYDEAARKYFGPFARTNF